MIENKNGGFDDGGGGVRTFFFCWKFCCGDVVRGGARVELSSKVENVIFGKTCRRETIKAAQGFNLCLLRTVICGVRIRPIKSAVE